MSSYPGKIRIIAGSLKGRKIPVLEEQGLRPTPDRVRETLFNWLQGQLVDSLCLDCFAGTGILGFEALSRGAKNVIMIDRNPAAVKLLQTTCSQFEIPSSRCQILSQDALYFLKKSGHTPVDLIFLDPPFQEDLLEKSLNILPTSGLLGEKTFVYVEQPKEKPEPVLSGFAVYRSQFAGIVGYYLLKKSDV